MGRHVIVTGSSRGIGKSVAERLKADGFTVVTHSVMEAIPMRRFETVAARADETDSVVFGVRDFAKKGAFPPFARHAPHATRRLGPLDDFKIYFACALLRVRFLI